MADRFRQARRRGSQQASLKEGGAREGRAGEGCSHPQLMLVGLVQDTSLLDHLLQNEKADFTRSYKRGPAL